MAISGNQWQSVAIGGNPWQSVAIRHNQSQSVAIRGNQSQSVAISGNQHTLSSKVARKEPSFALSAFLTCPRVVLRGQSEGSQRAVRG